MTVAFVVPRLQSGGAEHVMRLIAGHLHENRQERVFLISLLDRTEDRPPEQSGNLEILCLGCKRVMTAFPRLMKVLLGQNVRCVVSTLPHVIRLVSITRILLGGRFAHIARLANTYSQQARHVNGKFREPVWLTKLVNVGVSHFIAVSEGVKADFEATYGVPASQITVVNNPVNLSKFEYMEEAVLDPRYVHILMVGRLVDQKNIPLAFRAFSKMRQLGYKDLRLTLVGEGPLRPELENMARELGIDDSVQFKGFQQHVGDFYRAANVFLLTSFYEGFPNVLVEALAHGLPVVSVDCPSGPSDILVNHELGRLVSYDENEIAHALKDCIDGISDAVCRQRRKDYICTNYSLDALADRYRQIIDLSKLSGLRI